MLCHRESKKSIYITGRLSGMIQSRKNITDRKGITTTILHETNGFDRLYNQGAIFSECYETGRRQQ